MTDTPPDAEHGDAASKQATEKHTEPTYDTRPYVKEVAKQLSEMGETGFEVATYPTNRQLYLLHRQVGLTMHVVENTIQIHYPHRLGERGLMQVEMTKATYPHAAADVIASLTQRLEERRRAPVIPRGSHTRQW